MSLPGACLDHRLLTLSKVNCDTRPSTAVPRCCSDTISRAARAAFLISRQACDFGHVDSGLVELLDRCPLGADGIVRPAGGGAWCGPRLATRLRRRGPGSSRWPRGTTAGYGWQATTSTLSIMPGVRPGPAAAVSLAVWAGSGDVSTASRGRLPQSRFVRCVALRCVSLQLS